MCIHVHEPTLERAKRKVFPVISCIARLLTWSDRMSHNEQRLAAVAHQPVDEDELASEASTQGGGR